MSRIRLDQLPDRPVRHAQRFDLGVRRGWLRGPLLAHLCTSREETGPVAVPPRSVPSEPAAVFASVGASTSGASARCPWARRPRARRRGLLSSPDPVTPTWAASRAWKRSAALSSSWPPARHAQVHEQWRRDEDRRVGADRDADEQRQAEVEEGAGAEQREADDEDRGDRQERDDRRVDGPDQGLVDGEVRGLGVRHPPREERLRGVLADLVEDDDGVVERVPEDREEPDHRRRRDLEPEQGVDPDRDDQVVGRATRPATAIFRSGSRRGRRHEDEEDDQRLDRLGVLTDWPHDGPMRRALTLFAPTPNACASWAFAASFLSPAASVWTRTVLPPMTVGTMLPGMPA